MHQGKLAVLLRRWWLFLSATVLAAALVVVLWVVRQTPDEPTVTAARLPNTTEVAREQTLHFSDPAPIGENVSPRKEVSHQHPLTDRQLAEAAQEADCPWPPRPDNWRDLSGECLDSLNHLLLNDVWRLALHDPLGDRAAVSDAFDIFVCHVPTGDVVAELTPQPGLYHVCAAESMIRVALLQRMCARTVVNVEELERTFEKELERIHKRVSDSSSDVQGRYYRLIEDHVVSRVRKYWKAHTCRSVPRDALQWIAALPPPAIKPGDPPPPQAAWVELPDGSSFHGTLPPPLPSDYTQEEALFRAARRVDADVSRWWGVP